MHTEVNVSAAKLLSRRREEGATVYAVACVARSNTAQKLVARTLLPNVHFLESSSFKLSCHQELCVPCLLLVEIQRSFLCRVLFREGWRSVPVLLPWIYQRQERSQHGAFGRQHEQRPWDHQYHCHHSWRQHQCNRIQTCRKW